MGHCLNSLSDMYTLSDQIWDLRVQRNKLSNYLTIEAFKRDEPQLFTEPLKEQDHVQDE